MAQLRLQPVGTQWQARIDNGLAGPPQIQLRAAPDTRSKASRSSRSSGRQQPGGRPPARPDRGPHAGSATAVGAEQPGRTGRSVAYRLPFDAARLRVDQAPQGRFSHDDEENRDAVDFAPEGTLVLAAREAR